MNPCDQVADALAEGADVPAALRGHVEGCARCRALAATDDALAAMVNVEAPDDAPPMPAALRSALDADHAPVAPYAAWRVAAPPLALASLVALWAFARNARPDLAHLPAAGFALAVATLAALVVTGVALVASRGARGIGVEPARRAAWLVASFALFEGVMALTTAAVEGSVVPDAAHATHVGVHCASAGALVASIVGVALFAAARRTALTSPTSSGALAGASSGFAGALFLQIVCPVATLSHTMVAHAAPAVVGAAVGAAVGRWWLAP